ncbi:MAG: type III pantothenate kinase [Spiroplasma sp.]
MILLIDIGNTLTKLALAIKEKNNFSLLKVVNTKTNNWESTIQKILLANKAKIKDIIICCVVPEKLIKCNKIITVNFKCKPIIFTYELTKFLPLKIALKEKEKTGSDLIALAVASYHQFGNSITVSLGTATTYTIIHNSTLKGVIIAPGFTSAKTSLTSEAALIKPFKITNYSSVLGNNTIHALSIGYGNGFNYMIDGTIKAINKELKDNLKTIITGGNFQELKPFLQFKYQYQDNLVLKGLIIIYQILKKNNKLKGIRNIVGR